jgi:hypothetical protein
MRPSDPRLLEWKDDDMPTDKRVTVRTEIAGIVNGEAMKGRVAATLDTGVGGRSTCRFSKLPSGFTPGTFGTHT